MNAKQFYSSVLERDDLSFSNLSRSDTRKLTHSYHKYPAKFIPQLANALISEYTNKEDIIWDPFCGSGTLNVEAFSSNRDSIGTDLNPISVLISKVKTTLLEPSSLTKYVDFLIDQTTIITPQSEEFYLNEGFLNGNLNVIRKWFSIDSLCELGHILYTIEKSVVKKKYKNFAICAFSSILKRSSYWLNSSVKSQIDPNKNPQHPLFYFVKQLKAMAQKNKLFYEKNRDNKALVRIFRHNAKHNLSINIEQFDSIITSPPYIVSYDYSDIFRLSTYFLYYKPEYIQFRRNFIGTPLKKGSQNYLINNSHISSLIDSIDDKGINRIVLQYYNDMSIYFSKIINHVKISGNMILIVGDTKLRGAKINNAFLLTDIAVKSGWSFLESYSRNIPVKILPTYRDKNTGKFTNKHNENKSERYNKEYILVFRREQ